MSDEETPKLRMASPEPVSVLARRFEREEINANRERLLGLENSLAPLRVGSVRYLNAVPLTRGLESEIQFDVPARLAERLRRGDLDAALVSVTEVLFSDCYDVLEGVAIASLGEVKSVFLAHRKPIEQATEIYCDPASLTSVNLLRVLLGERGLKPEFKPLASYDPAIMPDHVLLIGDPALTFLLGPHEHEIFDLGSAWMELTGLPFVFAVWALRRGIENRELRRRLVEAKAFGLDTLEQIVRGRTEFTEDFRRDYLGWHIHYHLGSEEKRGLQRFIGLLRQHVPGPVFEPRFVS